MERETLRSHESRREVHLEACDDGVNPKTRVSVRVYEADGMREVSRLFDSLAEALAYAQRFYEAA